VHQDGLVHVSQIADKFVKDPNDVVKVGMKVKVTVQSVDLPRSRIALSMRSDGGMGPRAGASAEGGTRRDVQQNNQQNAPQRGGARPAPGKPAPKPFVPTKGAVAPNGIRFK
jgi:uncharacterized protein